MLDQTGSAEVLAEVKPKKPADYERTKLWLEGCIAAGKKKPVAEVISLTPTVAMLLLERNPVNRPINKRNVYDLASDIANNRFEFNGESIVVSNTGVLLDGQHRCGQVIATGKAIETVIVFGPKEAARFTIDTGKSKSVSNYLAMKGRRYSSAVGPAVSYYLQWAKNGFIDPSGFSTPTKAEILAAADELKGFDKSIEATSVCMKTTRGHAVLAFCHYVFTKKSTRENADEFMIKLIEGESLRKGDPILYCRNRLLGSMAGSRPNSKIELIFKCWNAWRQGNGIDHCKLTGKLPKVER